MFQELNIFLDDIRSPDQCHYMHNASVYRTTEWKIVRNYDEFVGLIESEFKKGIWPKTISFDHDLGHSHYGIPVTKETYDSVYLGLEEKTGLDCAKFLVNFCLEHSLELPHCMVHSMNTVGTENIISLLQNFIEFRANEK